ncbi:Uncharacterised protein [Mycobacteroides abscessus subsp. massiliense]|uniref:hypothetical protein n=1 Tax=Mycobacteroides abscessus TaxID=36809 RepID=UPI0009A5AA49|nr:hypothetical protein [Mycobacteroides abscessus]SKK75330.1 Uncharacterised protein [Mycobacteroides abscessus subsp. massiliense]SKL00717.1 Uncharacterised protein [Mycobacteroides abscessus subsp. massiliense]SKM11199.1 Uncharacterised protein [Mycobacteroides abscessus subsp. massiliense]
MQYDNLDDIPVPDGYTLRGPSSWDWDDERNTRFRLLDIERFMLPMCTYPAVEVWACQDEHGAVYDWLISANYGDTCTAAEAREYAALLLKAADIRDNYSKGIT